MQEAVQQWAGIDGIDGALLICIRGHRGCVSCVMMERRRAPVVLQEPYVYVGRCTSYTMHDMM